MNKVLKDRGDHIRMRIIGGLIVILACGLGGMVVARGFDRRPKDLQAFLVSLQLLQTEIEYARTALPEAIGRVVQQTSPPISCFWQQVLNLLTQGEVITAEAAWEQALPQLDQGAFTKEDSDTIAELGKVLGRSDVSDQCKHLVLLQKQLSTNMARAEGDRDKNVRLWNYLGFCVGALVVILLY